MSEEARQALSKWLRHHRQDDEEGITVTIARQACDEAADLIDQQAAEIERLKEELQERIDQILHMSDTIDMREEQRDEWRRRAKRLLVLATKHCNKYHHDWREITEAAQWFED